MPNENLLSKLATAVLDYCHAKDQHEELKTVSTLSKRNGKYNEMKNIAIRSRGVIDVLGHIKNMEGYISDVEKTVNGHGQ